MSVNSIVNPQVYAAKQKIREDFTNAQPYKHILIEDFLTAPFLQKILSEFPKVNDEELINEFGGASKKHVVHDVRSIGDTFRQWDSMLKSPEFISWMESITGIEGLVYDPEYHGAGTHNNLHGQAMDVHVDFNLHRTTGYHRRLNLIIYLNEEWKEEWGGGLAVHKDPWNPDKDRSVTYPPSANHAIIFETNEYSWHGFNEITLPEGKRHLSRKSLTVYYYSKERPAHEIAPKHSTIYVQKPLSKDIQPNQIITTEQYNQLEKNFKKRNYFLKALYGRETKLLQRIENQKFYIKQLEENLRVPIIGFAKQNGKVNGILPNLKVEKECSVPISMVKPGKQLSILGFIPDWVNGGQNHLTVKIDDKVLIQDQPCKGHFELKKNLPSNLNKDFTINVSGTHSNSPSDAGLNNDKRKTAFRLDHLLFE